MQINIIVSDSDKSRDFYAALGCALRPITLPGDDTPHAWIATNGFAPIAIHTPTFAAWWDPSAPTANPGATIIDITFDTRSEAIQCLEDVPKHGGHILQPLTNMPWGEAYAIFTDPDGYRWGIKTTPSPA